MFAFYIIELMVMVSFGASLATTDLTRRELNLLNAVREDELDKCVSLGLQSMEQIKRFETRLINNRIIIQNGSFAHTMLIDRLPNNQTIQVGTVATKIVKSAQFFYNSICAPMDIPADKCQLFLSQKRLPDSTTLFEECEMIQKISAEQTHGFNRLLSAQYEDGIYEMAWKYERPSPRQISRNFKSQKNAFDDKFYNLLIALLGQFIEHDISKPVATMMLDGSAIDCCNKFNLIHSPRYQHPACAPIKETIRDGRFSKEVCLNYVRSSLSVPPRCNFESGSQINQATGVFDLSQLYGHGEDDKRKMRLFKGGQMKISGSTKLHQSFLPLRDENLSQHCTFIYNQSSNCFIAGDSRVNRSPYTTLMYTLFLRNHNQLAKTLENQNPHKKDEQLFEEAKSINIDIYNRIIFDEWLPAMSGEHLSMEIKRKAALQKTLKNVEVSNEVAIGPLRYYFSMLPNNLKKLHNILAESNFSTSANIFDYTPSLNYSISKLNNVLKMVLQDHSMKCDQFYEENFIPENLINGNSLKIDVLAFDIQRGRDHGLQSYVKYLEILIGKQITSWDDLEDLIAPEDVRILKSVYKRWDHIDFLVGGLSEKSEPEAILGKTFGFIFGEQLSKSYAWYMEFLRTNLTSENSTLTSTLTNMKLADLICSNSDMQRVPKNILKIPSEKNPLISCDDYIRILS